MTWSPLGLMVSSRTITFMMLLTFLFSFSHLKNFKIRLESEGALRSFCPPPLGARTATKAICLSRARNSSFL
ncbi:hypothetical protein BJX96DRAFT_154965 [Aspergillus floccosus]